MASAPRYQKRRICDCIRTDTDVTLFDKLDSLHDASDFFGRVEPCRDTHRRDSLCHFAHAHKDGQTASAEGRDGKLVLDVAELGGRVEHAHVVELGEQLGLHASPKRVLRWQEGYAMRKRP